MKITSHEILEKRFWKNVQKTHSCWEWTGSRFRSKWGPTYGAITYKRTKTFSAHRLSWRIHFGEFPKHKFVLHSCDNMACVNPKHLYLGDHQKNMRDMANRGRSVRGEANNKHKFSENQVIEIRNLRSKGMSTYKIWKIFPISKTYKAVKDICNRRTWKHIQKTSRKS